jgi:hypothetical protein
MFKFGFGDEVKDSITELQGVITARAEYMNGCLRYGVVLKKLQNADVVEIWLDEGRLILKKAKKPEKVKKRPGGTSNPTFNSAPR